MRTAAFCALLGGGSGFARVDIAVTYPDPDHDWLLRPTDPDGALPYDPAAHRPIDLLEITLGRWQPDDATANLFDGQFVPPGKFFRLDLTLAGLVNPPGSTRPWDFDPFAYGAHPVFGFIELDVDGDVETGGELEAPQYRYAGNAVRFGGLPVVEGWEDRFAREGAALDGDFETPPYVERSGEEGHLALLGSVFVAGDVFEVMGDGDLCFAAGEVWWITGPWFHRAHGYEPFSLAIGGHAPGVYEPASTVQFAHHPDGDVTVVSVVYPLTNAGAAEMWDQDPEPPDGDPSNQFSIHEALQDLHLSAVFLDEYPTGLPEETIIEEWKDKDPDDYLDPDAWRITALLGTTYTAAHASGEYFVWTDVWPSPLRGDVNGDGEVGPGDEAEISGYIEEFDVDDGAPDGQVTLAGFPVNFSVFDVDHSSRVNPFDSALVGVPGDFDEDCDVDLADFATFQACGGTLGAPGGLETCGLADLDTDGEVGSEDWYRLEIQWTVPGPGPCIHDH